MVRKPVIFVGIFLTIIFGCFLENSLAFGEFKSEGINLGIFRLYPTAVYSGVFSDNIFLEETDEQDDYFSVVDLGVDFSLNLSRHLLRGGYLASIRRANDFEIFNKTDQRFDLAFDINFRSGMKITIFDEFGDLTIDPRFLGDTRKDYYNNRGGLTTEFLVKDSYKFRVGYTNQIQRFDEMEDSIDDFDRNMVPAGFYYKIRPHSWIIFEYLLTMSDHELDARDNEINQILGGWEFFLTDKLTTTVKTGFLSIDYDLGDSFGTAPIFLDLKFKPQSYSTINLGVTRKIRETTFAEENALNGLYYTTTVFSLLLRHEFSLKVAGTVDGFFNLDRFPVLPETDKREDDGYGFGASLEYWLRDSIFTSLGYRYRVNDSNFEVYDYIENVFTFRGGILFRRGTLKPWR